jgi:hypothetical protein
MTSFEKSSAITLHQYENRENKFGDGVYGDVTGAPIKNLVYKEDVNRSSSKANNTKNGYDMPVLTIEPFIGNR